MKKNKITIILVIIFLSILLLSYIYYTNKDYDSFLGKIYFTIVNNDNNYGIEKPSNSVNINISGKVISSTTQTGISQAKVQCEISYNDISGQVLILGTPHEVSTTNSGFFENIAFSAPTNKNIKYICESFAEGFHDGYEEKIIGTLNSDDNTFNVTISLVQNTIPTKEITKSKIPTISKLVNYKIIGGVCELNSIKDVNKLTCSSKAQTTESSVQMQIYPYGIHSAKVTCRISGDATKNLSIPQEKTISTSMNGAFKEEMVFQIYSNEKFTRTCEFSAPEFLTTSIQKIYSYGITKNSTEDVTQILQRDPSIVETN